MNAPPHPKFREVRRPWQARTLFTSPLLIPCCSKRAIELDSGIGLLPAPSVERELKLGTLVCRPLLDVEFTRPVGLIHRRGRELSQTVKRFIHLLVEHRRNSKCSVEEELETLLEKLQVGVDVQSVSTTSENTLPEDCPNEQIGSKTPDYVGNGKP